MKISATITGLGQSVASMRRAVRTEMRRSADKASKVLVESIKQTHPFQNRTGNLEESIGPLDLDSDGDVLEGELLFGAEASMDYASYVNDMPQFEYMNLGYMLAKDEVDDAFFDGLEAAARAIG
jgi:hypothetical protein